MDKVINFCNWFMFLDMQKAPLLGMPTITTIDSVK
jgi:hypothetical protein